jgi:hypothetical protein
MAALVLGLLISSEKGSFDTVNGELVQMRALSTSIARRPNTETHGLVKNTYAESIRIYASRDATHADRELKRKPEYFAPLGRPRAREAGRGHRRHRE